jgi:hypothetical protein
MKDPVHHLREERDAEGFMRIPERKLKIPQCLFNERPDGLEEL